MKKLLVLFAISLSLAACQQEGNPHSPLLPPPDLDEAISVPSGKPILPAYKLPGDFRSGKADQYTDHKDDNPGTYGITNPPTVGIRPVAEYEPAARLMITMSSTGLSSGMKKNLAEIVKYGKDVSDVYILYDSNSIKSSFSTTLQNNGVSPSAATWVNMTNDSVWIRDYGPIPILSKSGNKVGMVDMRYYNQRIYDDSVPTKLANLWNVSVYRAPLDFEGGNFMSDTVGNCFASEGLLWYNGVGQEQLKEYMKDYLGCTTTHIMKTLANEGTTHIDMQMKLVDDNTVIVGEYTYQQDSQNYAITNQNAGTFESLGYNVVRMPMPSNSDGAFRTFINSLFVNGVNMVPVYSIDKAKEAQAMAIWEQVMPTWQHVPMNSDDVIQMAGAIHCITMTTGSGSFTPMESAPGYACGGDWACYPGATDPQGCDGITYEGCCDGNLLKYCDGNKLKSINCGNDPQCGWESQSKFYNCGTNGGSDPSGQFQKDCDGGCTSKCGGKECGSDGCGGSCGSCSGGQTCQDGQCVGGGDQCGGITYEGCCNGNTLTYCEENELKSIDCNSKPQCGWDSENKFYNCGTSGGTDPAGQFSKDCNGCTPQCAGSECGADGCGGLCGQCANGESCVQGICLCTPQCDGKDCGPDGCGSTCGACPGGFSCTNGKCNSECVADCTGKTCGDNGCGGSCGTCSAGQVCQSGQCNDVEDPCLGIGWEGCCLDTVLHWCEGGAIESLNCGSSGCGWNAGQGYYDCNQTGADSSGQFPLACDGSECIPNCADKECGEDGCGGSCGTCDANELCDSGMCTGGSGCGDVTYAGYCDGSVLGWCEDNALHLADCAKLDGNFVCEWYEDGQGYYCVAKPDCVPNCSGKECGDDGCGGTCGKCANDESCQNGQCEAGPCDADCTGKECGDDGCGGSCGTCPANWTCQSGECFTDCQPNCGNKECGDDGCGGTCGSCTGDKTCQQGICTAGPCEPDCAGKECGDDGCEGSCGSCGDNSTCDHGTCIPVCMPDCTGYECGSDGCDGSCGACPAGFSCADHKCEQGCTPACDGLECGDDGCGGVCGSCPANEVCLNGQCSPDCTPDCSSKDCGPDGCGGTCGDCPKDFTCDSGACVSNPGGCGNVTSVGQCEGELLKKCVSNEVITIDCAETGKVCSFVPGSGVFDCVDQCLPNCAGKVCGEDGCGGFCGTCPKAYTCEMGVCVEGGSECVVDCTGKECGDDGCGGSCGVCAGELVCVASVCTEGSGLEGDVVSDSVGDNNDGEQKKAKGSGCSSTGSGQPLSLALFLILGLGLAVFRRRLA